MRRSSVDQVIIEILSKGDTHQTSLQIFEKARDILPAVNISTIYRSLERLLKKEIVSVSDMGLGSTVYELVTEFKHHHLVCQECGRILMITDDDVSTLFSRIQNEHRFRVITNHLILFGICQNCQKKEIQT